MKLQVDINPATGMGATTRLGPTETMMQDFTSFNGAPVLINDLQDVDCDGENTCGECGRRHVRDIWFSILGARGLHGIIPDWLTNPFVVRSTTSTEISATFTQVAFPVGLALASQGALAVIKNVTCCGRCDAIINISILILMGTFEMKKESDSYVLW